MLKPHGGSWKVIGPADVVVPGATVRGRALGGFQRKATELEVLVGRVSDAWLEGDVAMVVGYPTRRCSGRVSGKPCTRVDGHAGWCRAC